MHAIATAVATTIEPYVGQSNATEYALAQIRLDLANLFQSYQTPVSALLGPIIVSVGTISVSIDPLIASRIIVQIPLVLPQETRTIDLTIQSQ